MTAIYFKSPGKGLYRHLKIGEEYKYINTGGDIYVQFDTYLENSYYKFTQLQFDIFFKTVKQQRKDKLNKIYESNLH